MMPETENNGARSLWKMPSWTAEELGLSVDLPQLVVPITNGLCARKEDAPTVFVCFAAVGIVLTCNVRSFTGDAKLLLRILSYYAM